MCLCVTGHVECTFEEGSRVLHRSGLLQQRPASHAPSTCDVRWDANARTRSHRSPHTETLPRFKARVAFRFRPRRVVMGSDSLNCYKPQCGAGVKWHMLLQARGGGPERQRGRWNRACSLGLFSHPLMKRTASPQGLLQFLASGRMRDICPSVTPQHTNTNTHSHSPSLPGSLSLSHKLTLPHSLTHFILTFKQTVTNQFLKSVGEK